MRQRLNHFLAVFLITFGITVSYAQYGNTHTVFNFEATEIGIHHQSWEIIQAPWGNMYFANGNGILEFNGEDWKLYLSETETNVLSIEMGPNELVYYGGIGNAGILKPNERGELEAIGLIPEEYRDSLHAQYFFGLYRFENKMVWRSDKYLMIYDGEEMEVIKNEASVAWSEKVDGELWILAPDHNIQSTSIEKIEPKLLIEDSSFVNEVIVRVLPLSEDLMWLLGVEGTIWEYDLRRKELSKTHIESLKGLHIRDAVLNPNGNLVVGTQESGIIELDEEGKVKYHFHLRNGLLSNSLRGLYYDNEGVLWATSDAGVSKIMTNEPYTILNEENTGFSGVVVSAVEHENAVYLATGQGVFRIPQVEINSDEKTQAKKVRDLNFQFFQLKSIKGSLFGSSPTGLYEINGLERNRVDAKYARAIGSPLGYDDRMIVAGRATISLFRKIDNEWKLMVQKETPDEALTIQQDYSENGMVFWVSLFSTGALRVKVKDDFTDLSIMEFNDLDGESPGYLLPFWVNNEICFSAKTGGVYSLDRSNKLVPNEFLKENFPNPLDSWLITQDQKSNIYLENAGPMYILSKEEKDWSIDSTTFSTLDMGYINEMFFDSKGIPWLVCDLGLVKVEHKVEEKSDGLGVVLSYVQFGEDSIVSNGFPSIDGKINLMDFGASKTYDYGLNSVQFDFYAPTSTYPEAVEYSYQLIGFDNGASEWDKEHMAKYTNLYEGEYVFEIRSKDVYGNVSDPVRFPFTIAPPWHRTIIAYVLYVLLGGLFVYLLIRLNSARLKRANERLKSIVDEKTAEVSAQRDELADQRLQLIERNKEIVDSIEYAKRLQDAILPPLQMFKDFCADSFVLYMPKDIVAGDFYWTERVKTEVGTTIYFAVADCTGHGVPGAMVSVVCHNALSRSVKEFGMRTTGDILDKVTDLVLETFRAGDQKNFLDVKDGMDIALCALKLNPEGQIQSLEFSGANNPMFVISPRENLGVETAVRLEGDKALLHEIKATRQPVGWSLEREPFKTTEIEIEKGESVYLFSDGYPDQFGGPKRKKLKTKNFKLLLMQIFEKEMGVQETWLEDYINDWKADLAQIDDICVMGIRF